MTDVQPKFGEGEWVYTATLPPMPVRIVRVEEWGTGSFVYLVSTTGGDLGKLAEYRLNRKEELTWPAG